MDLQIITWSLSNFISPNRFGILETAIMAPNKSWAGPFHPSVPRYDHSPELGLRLRQLPAARRRRARPRHHELRRSQSQRTPRGKLITS